MATTMYKGKRAFDIMAAMLFLVLVSPVLLLVGVALAVSSGFPVIFRQARVGKDGKLFEVYKFRTMRKYAEKGGFITVKDDPRITPVGRILRKFKLDELPQFVNVIKGDMSIVGPRPDVAEYCSGADLYGEGVKPGITGFTSLMFKDEVELLDVGNSRQDGWDVRNNHHLDPPPSKGEEICNEGWVEKAEEVYRRDILPMKARINKEYKGKAGLIYDCEMIIKTLGLMFR